MKKIFALTSFLAAVIFAATTFAAVQETIGVVIVGNAEFKTADYYKSVKSSFKNSQKVGDEMQSKYQRFLLENDLLDETTPHKKNLIDFAARSGCNKVLFLFVNSNSDHQNNAKSRQKNRLTVQVDAYLCDGLQVLDVQTTSQDSNSKTSDLRARREAFNKCVKELSKVVKY